MAEVVQGPDGSEWYFDADGNVDIGTIKTDGAATVWSSVSSNPGIVQIWPHPITTPVKSLNKDISALAERLGVEPKNGGGCAVNFDPAMVQTLLAILEVIVARTNIAVGAQKESDVIDAIIGAMKEKDDGPGR